LAPIQIALETRIITTADIFDAITAARPYREAVPVPRTLESAGLARGPSCVSSAREACESKAFRS
jgi:response regulator RpfG family c-di-GMP phosphodiesterase